IDIVATDHAPHPAEAKDCEWEAAAFGMVGLESALPVVIAALVEPGHLDLEGVARVLSSAPAEIGSLEGYRDGIAVGAPANLTLIDLSARAAFDEGRLRSRSVNSPSLGRELPGRIAATVHDGYPTVLD